MDSSENQEMENQVMENQEMENQEMENQNKTEEAEQDQEEKLLDSESSDSDITLSQASTVVNDSLPQYETDESDEGEAILINNISRRGFCKRKILPESAEESNNLPTRQADDNLPTDENENGGDEPPEKKPKQ